VKDIKKRIPAVLTALSLLAPLSGFLLVRFRISIIPVLIRWFSPYVSPDGNVEEKTVQRLIEVISNHGIAIILLTFLPLLLLICGRVLSRMVPERSVHLEPAEETPIAGREWILLLLVLSVALIVRIPAVLHSLDDDEILAVVRFIKANDWIQTLTTFKLHNHIGYSLVARVCYKLLGDAEWILRLPSLLLGLATIYQLWVLSRKYVDRNIAMVSALFLAVLPFHVQYSTRARGYASMAFFMLLSTRYFLELLRKRDFSKSATFVLSSVAGIYFHLCGTFPLLVQFFFFLIVLLQVRFANGKSWSDRKCLVNLWFCLSAICLLGFLLYSPVLLKVVDTVESHGRGPVHGDFPAFVIMRFFGNFPLGIANLLLLIAGMVFVFKRQKVFAYFLLCMTFLPFFALWLISPADLVARFLFFELPYVCILTAAGFSLLLSLLKQQTRSSRIVRGALLGAAALMICFQAKLSWKDIPQIAFREAVRMMYANASARTAICATGYGAEFYQYYSSSPILILKSKEEFDKLLPEFREVRCAYISTDWPTADKELIRFLTRNARIRHTPGIIVFIYRNPKNRRNKGW